VFRGEGGGGRVTELPVRCSQVHDGRVTELAVRTAKCFEQQNCTYREEV
jgi:hypothetical protein